MPPYPTFPPYAPPSVPAPRRHGAAVAVGIVAAVVVGALALGLGVTALTDLTRENAGTTMEGVDAEDAWYVEDLDSSGLWVEDLRAGDCFFDGPLDGPWSGPDEPSAGWQVDVVDCDDEHPMEVVGDFELTGDRPPRADEDFFLATEDRCWSILEDYAAPGALTDDLWVDFYWPSRESWREGDRLVTCVAATSRLRTGSIVRDAAST
ncbi:MAG TPA: septum formation family protein [Nocardioides sp.]